MRKSFTRREPVIALEEFRFKRRVYKEGSPLDMRRCQMLRSTLRKLLRENKVVMAQDLSESELEKLGFWYDPMSPRMRLRKLEDKKVVLEERKKLQDEIDKKYKKDPVEPKETLAEKNDRLMSEFFSDAVPDSITKKEDTAVSPEEKELKPYIFDRGKDWYDVRQGEEVLKKRVRKGTAEKFLAELEGGE